MSRTRLTEIEQLILDYNSDNRRVWKQAIAWLTPKDPWGPNRAEGTKERIVGKLPKKSEMTESENQKDNMGKAQKIFQAVTKYAQSPKKAKKPKSKGKKDLAKPDSKNKYDKDDDLD